MSLGFIPTVWAARLLVALEKALIYGQANVSNRDYEGEIRKAGKPGEHEGFERNTHWLYRRW